MQPRRPDLAHGFDRVDDFLAVQGPGIPVDAVKLLQEAVGVDDGGRAIVRDRVAALVDSGHGPAVGSVLLGILVGLFAADQELRPPTAVAPRSRGTERVRRRHPASTRHRPAPRHGCRTRLRRLGSGDARN